MFNNLFNFTSSGVVQKGALLNYFAEYWNRSPVFENGLLKDNVGVNSLIPVNRACLLGDGTAYLSFANLPTYDAITVEEDGIEVSISLTSGDWTPTSGKYYNNVVFTNAGADVAKFTLEDYPSLSYSRLIIYTDIYGVANAVLTSGTTGNFGDYNGLSRMTEKGFNLAVITDGGDDYVDSGINVRTISKIEARIRYIGGITSTTSSFWGAGSTGSNNGFMLGYRSTGNYFSGGYISSLIDNQSADNEPHTHTLEIDAANFDAVYDIDGNSVNITNSSGQPEDENFILNARKASSSILNSGPWEIQYCKIWVSDVLVRDFVAQKDGTLLDTVNNVSYQNEGAGGFKTKSIPADIVNILEDIGGVGLYYSAENSQGVANKYKAPVSAEFYEIDIEEKFYDSGGTPKTIDFDTWTDADYTESLEDEIGNITSLKVKKKVNKYPAILVAGQSNTEGKVPLVAFPTSFVDENGQTINYLNASDEIENSYYNKNNTDGNFNTYTLPNLWSYEAVALKRLTHYTNKDVYLINRSLASTAISVYGTGSGGFWTPDFDAIDAWNLANGESNEKLIQLLKTAYDNSDSRKFEIKAMLWHQGESDQVDETAENEYYDNLKAVIAYVRGFTGNSNLPVIYGTISHLRPNGYSTIVEKAFFDIASEDNHVHVIDMSNGTLLDDAHFDATSSEYLGTEMYKIIRDNYL